MCILSSRGSAVRTYTLTHVHTLHDFFTVDPMSSLTFDECNSLPLVSLQTQMIYKMFLLYIHDDYTKMLFVN